MTQPPDSTAPEQTTPKPNRPDNRALYFLIVSAAILFIAMLALVFSQFIKTGREVASNSDKPAAAEQSEEASSELDSATAEMLSIKNEDSCFPDSATSSIIDYTTAAVAADAWNNSAQEKISEVLAHLDKNCNIDEKLQIQNAMTDPSSPPQLNSLVTDQSWISLTRPIPDDAVHVTSFTTPTLNIRCLIEDEAVCTIYAYDFPSPSGCTGQPATFRIGKTGKAKVDCDNTIAASTDQPYGTTVAANGLACTIEESGVTCWSALTGKGFQIRREGQRTF